eukprot:GFUD01035122.1.p1 GENE.GFUD01035122.1~~GFUD01035122.1.p1  ORF type:complete len:212 (+),score=55.50 GFUD01035122.1:69-704(+)
MHHFTIFLSLLIVPLVSSIRMRREIEKSKTSNIRADKVEKFIEWMANKGATAIVEQVGLIDRVTNKWMAKKEANPAITEQVGLIDMINDVSEVNTEELVTGRTVRRRRSVNSSSGSGTSTQGVVTLESFRKIVVEIKTLFEIVMEKLVNSFSLSKKLELKNLENEMNLMIDKLLKDLKEMKADEARDQEVEKQMRTVEESHVNDLPSEYTR